MQAAMLDEAKLDFSQKIHFKSQCLPGFVGKEDVFVIRTARPRRLPADSVCLPGRAVTQFFTDCPAEQHDALCNLLRQQMKFPNCTRCPKAVLLLSLTSTCGDEQVSRPAHRSGPDVQLQFGPPCFFQALTS